MKNVIAENFTVYVMKYEKIYGIIKEKCMKIRGYIMEGNMRITNFTIGGFKNLERTTFCLDNIMALVGENNYGKSNIFHALDFALTFIHAPNEMKNNMMSMNRCLPLNKKLQDEPFYFEIEMALNENESESINNIKYSYEFEWIKKDDGGRKIFQETLKMRSRKINSRYEKLLSREIDKCLYKKNEGARCSSPLAIKYDELAINKLDAMGDWKYQDIINLIKSINFKIEKHLDPNSMYAGIPIMFKGEDVNNTDDLPFILYSLQKNNADDYEILKNAFLQLFPSISDIVIASHEFKRDGFSKIFKNKDDLDNFLDEAPFIIKDQVHRLYIVDKNLNQPIESNLMSDGTKRILALLTDLLINKNRCSIIAIEEPENSIHPSLLRAFLTILKSLNDNITIMLASHSPFIIQYLKLDEIYIGLPNTAGVAEFKTINGQRNKKLVAKTAEDLDINIGEYIFELLNSSARDVDDRRFLYDLVGVE